MSDDFEKKFPGLKHINGIDEGFKWYGSKEISEACLDKSRVRKAIEKCFPEDSFEGDVGIRKMRLMKELGLE